MMKKLTPVFAAFLCVMISGPAVGQFYTLNGSGLMEGISDNGIAVGSFNSPEYFMWEVGVSDQILIGGVPAGNGVGGQAKISNDGLFIGGTDLNTNTNSHEMARYDVAAGTWTTLGGIGGSSGVATSSGWNISGDGQSVVGLGWVNAGEAHASQWIGGSMNDLGSTVAGESSRANAVNFDGSVVGGWQDGAGRQGAVWVNGVQELIFTDPGLTNPADEVFDITGDGRYATGMGVGSFTVDGMAYRYDVDLNEYLELPNLDPSIGERFMAGAAVSDDGTLIGGGTWGFGPATFGIGFIWEEGAGTMTAMDYLMSKGFSEDDWGAGFEISFVSAMSSDGLWIGGWGRQAGGGNVSWAAYLGGAVIPEPASAMFPGAFVMAVACIRRRRQAWSNERQ